MLNWRHLIAASVGSIVLGLAPAGAQSALDLRLAQRPVAKPQEAPSAALSCSAGAHVVLMIDTTNVPLRVSVQAVPVPGTKGTSVAFTVSPNETPFTKELRQLVGLATANALTDRTDDRLAPADVVRVSLDTKPEDGRPDVHGSIGCATSQATIGGASGSAIRKVYLIK